MPHGTEVYYKHPNPFDFLPQARGIIDLLGKWGYMLDSDSKLNPERIGQYCEVAVPSPKDFSNINIFSGKLSYIRRISIYFKNNKMNRKIDACYNFDDARRVGAHYPIWRIRFHDIDIDPGMAVCNTDITRLGSSYYYTMEELLLTYNLIKAIYLDSGFDVAAASREKEAFAYMEQVGSDPYCAYDGLIRLDRHGINRLIVPYEECRRIVSSDTDHNTNTGVNFRVEYDHSVPIIVREPPYHID